MAKSLFTGCSHSRDFRETLGEEKFGLLAVGQQGTVQADQLVDQSRQPRPAPFLQLAQDVALVLEEDPPGRRLGFGGTEARGVIRDWSRTGLSGHYAAPGLGDMEPALRRVDVPVRAVAAARDWLAPRSSLDYLLSKTCSTIRSVTVLDEAALGTHADHFAWMRKPGAVVDALTA